MDTRISGKTSLYGVIGKPIAHTGSPVMYNFCFNHYGIDAVYLAFECDESEVPQTMEAYRRLGIKGGNVTMPCKQAVAKSVDRLFGAAEYIGAVNTIVNDDGVLTGHITDGEGVVLDLKDHGVSVENKDIVVFGAGGAATAIFTQLILDGAKSVSVFNRGKEGLEKVKKIAERIAMGDTSGDSFGVKLNFDFISEQELVTKRVREADILINATSVGMSGVAEGESVIKDVSAFHKDLVIYDCIYNPAKTRLMEDAVANGVPESRVIGGRGMLLWQGAKAFELFTGKEMPVYELKKFLGYI